jgi:hypothetical protein
MKLQEALALRIEPRLPGAQDIEAMNNRSIRLQALFEAFHRGEPSSEHYGCYTGLHEKALAEMPRDGF